ncbi:MAG TPA: response regulator [Tepidisphaeraceae bacterium]|nr:response regulator [Tepidisphaeraceae bacterium]
MAKILLVEDNEMNRDMLSRRLLRRGHEVLTAENGAQALIAAEDQKFDLVLMDLRLPDISGWDVTRQLRSRSANANLKIIALTAHAMEGDRQAAMDAGCDDYDTKPVDMGRLMDKIARLVG